MLIDDIALTLEPKIGPKTAAHLIAHFGTAEAIFRASEEELIQKAELNEYIARQLLRKLYHKEAERELAFCKKNDITVLTPTSEHYPALLKECNDYPHVLYYKGAPEALTQPMLSMVGTRLSTPYGRKMCNQLIRDLAQWFPEVTIVSGLALGIDAACHRAALAYGLRTIGVIADPLNRLSPAEHTTLAREMVRKGGGILSEYPSGFIGKGRTYTPRNRIIAGMSEGTVVIESRRQGGSLITANLADGYNRTVMALPGRAEDKCSEGTNRLIMGHRAHMVCSAEDIVRELGWEVPSHEEMPEYPTDTLSKDAKGLLSCIKEGETLSMDQLVEISGLTIQELAPLILELEFNGAIRMLPGQIYEKI